MLNTERPCETGGNRMWEAKSSLEDHLGRVASRELLDCINSLSPAVTVELYLWEKRTCVAPIKASACFSESVSIGATEASRFALRPG